MFKKGTIMNEEQSKKVVIKTLREVNGKKLCCSYFQKVLQNERGSGVDYCNKTNKINKYNKCCDLCSDCSELYNFWDYLVAKDKVNSKIKTDGSSEKLENINNICTKGLTDIIRKVYKSIVDRFSHTEIDMSIRLTVEDNDDLIINTIKKYYEVSHGWKPDHPSDNVTYPIFSTSSNKESDCNRSFDIDHQVHYIARDIARIFGTCKEGDNCKFNEKCRDGIHFTVESKSHEILYSIDDHIEFFRESIRLASKTIQKEYVRIDVNEESQNSRYKDAVSRPLTPILSNVPNKTKSVDVNYWVGFWLDTSENYEKLFKSLELQISEKHELIKLIKRILWKSKNSTTKIDINENYIQRKWKDYRNYKDGVSDINIDGISIRSATSEKHLSSDFKASNDDRQTFNKNCRKNSSRYNNFESYDIEHKVGFNVFDMENIHKINYMNLDVMAEFLGITLFQDFVFLIPSQFNVKYLKESIEEDFKWLDDDFRATMLAEINSGMLVQKLFNDFNVIDSYKNMLIESHKKREPFSNWLYGGNWIKSMYSNYPKDFLCIMFYFVNKDKTEYKGLDINMCKKQYCYYRNSLPSLKDPQCIKLFKQGIDSVFVEALPENWNEGKTYTREEYLNILVEYLLNYALTLQLKEYAPDEVTTYKNIKKDAGSLYDVSISKDSIKAKFLEMRSKDSEKSKSEKLKKDVLEKVLEELEKEKEWTSTFFRREGKRTSDISVAYVTKLIGIKLGHVTTCANSSKFTRVPSVSPTFRESMNWINDERKKIDLNIKSIHKEKSRLSNNEKVDQDWKTRKIEDIRIQTTDLHKQRNDLDMEEEICKKTEDKSAIKSLTEVLRQSVCQSPTVDKNKLISDKKLEQSIFSSICTD